MPKVRNIHHGSYGDGTIFVLPGEVVEVTKEQADYLCSPDTAGKFELVKDKPAPAAGGTK